MLGRVAGGTAFSAVSSGVRVWNNINPLGSNGSAFVSASEAQIAGVFERKDCNNLAVWFCDKVAKRYFDSVNLTLVALGGATIKYWSDTEAVYPLLKESIDVWAASQQSPADIFLWHQGEADLMMPPAEYIARFEVMRAALVEGGVLSQHAAILIGGIAETAGDKAAFKASALQRLAKSPGRGFATAYGLATTDGAHFDGKGLEALGARRYFSAYRFAASARLAAAGL